MTDLYYEAKCNICGKTFSADYIDNVMTDLKLHQCIKARPYLDEYMEDNGFVSEDTGGGCMWWAKNVEFKGEPALMAITDANGCNLPENELQEIYVGIYSIKTREPLIGGIEVSGIKAFFSLQNMIRNTFVDGE